MKKLLYLIFLISTVSYSQGDPITGSFGSPKTGTQIKGSLYTDSFLYLPRVNATKLPGYPGAIRYRVSDSSLQVYTGYQWLVSTGSGGGPEVDPSAVKNQIASPQTGNFWIGGIGKVDAFLGINATQAGIERFGVGGSSRFNGAVSIINGDLTISNIPQVGGRFEINDQAGRVFVIKVQSQGGMYIGTETQHFFSFGSGNSGKMTLFPQDAGPTFSGLTTQFAEQIFSGVVRPAALDATGKLGWHDFNYLTPDSLRSGKYGHRLALPLSALYDPLDNTKPDTLVIRSVDSVAQMDGYFPWTAYRDLYRAYNDNVVGGSYAAGTLTMTRRNGTTFNISGFSTGGSGSGLAVTNEANNRIITSISAGVGNAEANLTYDGSVLSVIGGRIEAGDFNNFNLFVGINSGANVAPGTTPIGHWNVGFGENALQDLTTGNDNLAFGASAGANITTAFHTVSIGTGANFFLTTGADNIAIGIDARANAVTAIRNIAIGNYAQYQNLGDENTSVGHSTLYGNGVGAYNTAMGYASMVGATNTTGNAAYGYYTLATQTTGGSGGNGYNSALGAYAGFTTNSSRGVFLGANAGYYSNEDDAFYVHNSLSGITTEALGKTNSMLYGNFGTSGANILRMNGKFGISISPTARLHLPAGTATANTAPLKFTSGTNLATPEDGAMEYDGTHIRFTIGSTRYQLDQQGGGGGATDHGLLTGLADDDHTQYALLAGRSGGTIQYGGIDAGDNYTVNATSNATKGTIKLIDRTSIGGYTDAFTSSRLYVSSSGTGVSNPLIVLGLGTDPYALFYLDAGGNGVLAPYSSNGFKINGSSGTGILVQANSNLIIGSGLITITDYSSGSVAPTTTGTEHMLVVDAAGVLSHRVVPSGGGGVTDHGALTGLADDDHTQYLLLAGRAGSQVANGGTGAGENLTLNSTSHATKGKIFFGGSSAYDGANFRLGINTVTPAALLNIVSTTNVGVTQTIANGIYLQNPFAATSGNQSISGAMVWEGQGYKTVSTAGSRAVAWRADVLPIQGTTNPQSQWQLSSSVNGSAFSNVVTVTDQGIMTMIGSLLVTSHFAVNSQVAAGTTNIAQSYRTTNGGSSIVPQIWAGSSAVTAGTLAAALDNTNMLSLLVANGTRPIAIAGLTVGGLTNTAGSEAGDLVVNTKPGGTAMREVARFTAAGGFNLPLSGAVVNFNAGDVLLTHSLNNLAISGGTLSVPDDAYASGWNGNVDVPTKNAIYDKIETLVSGSGTSGQIAIFNAANSIAASNIYYDAVDGEFGFNHGSPSAVVHAETTGSGSLFKGTRTGTTYFEVKGSTSNGEIYSKDLDDGTGVNKMVVANNGLLGIVAFDYGTYTPTGSGDINITTYTVRSATYLRIGNSVTVSGSIDITPAASSLTTTLYLTLPIASNFANEYNASGTSGRAAVNEAGILYADPTGDKIRLDFTSTTTAAGSVKYTYTYTVI